MVIRQSQDILTKMEHLISGCVLTASSFGVFGCDEFSYCVYLTDLNNPDPLTEVLKVTVQSFMMTVKPASCIKLVVGWG